MRFKEIAEDLADKLYTQQTLIETIEKAKELFEDAVTEILADPTKQLEQEKLDAALRKVETAENDKNKAADILEKSQKDYDERLKRKINHIEFLIEESSIFKARILEEINTQEQQQHEQKPHQAQQEAENLGIILSYEKSDELSENLRTKAVIEGINPNDLKLYNLKTETADHKEIETGNKFSFTTTNATISDNSEEQLKNAYRNAVIKTLETTLKDYNQKGLAEISFEDVSKFILIAEKFGGIGQVIKEAAKAKNSEDRKALARKEDLMRDFRKIFPESPNQAVRAAIDFSDLFQKNCKTQAQLFTGNQDCKNFVGLRLKRLDPIFAFEILEKDQNLEPESRLDKFTQICEKLNGQESLEKNLVSILTNKPRSSANEASAGRLQQQSQER